MASRMKVGPLTLGVLLGGWGLAKAQGDPLDLARALQIAEQQPLYRSYQERIRSLEARLVQAGKRPNPTLESELDTAFVEGSGDHVASLIFVQPWERGGKRSLRRQLAGARLEQGRQEARSYWNELESSIRLHFLQLWRLGRERELVQEEKKELEALLQYDQVRVREGEIPALHQHYWQSELAELDVLTQDLNNREELVRLRLGNLIGREDPETPFLPSPPPSALPLPPLEEALRVALESHPELALGEARLEEARLQVEMEKAVGKPDWEWGVGYHRIRSRLDGRDFLPPGVISSAVDTANMLELALRIPLPVWDDNSANLRAALAEREARQSEYEATRHRLAQQLRSAYRRVETSRQLQRLRQEQGSQLEGMLERLQASYRLRAEDLSELLDLRRRRLQLRLQQLQAAFSEGEAIVELNQAMGGSLLRGVP